MINALVTNGRLITLAIALLLVSGLGALNTLPRAEDPRITNRFSSVLTQFPGASAERVEALITEPLENQIRSVPEVDWIHSTSRSGVSLLQIRLKDTVYQPEPVWSRIRDKIENTVASLPVGSGRPELIDEKGYAFTSIVALTWQGAGQADIAVLGRYAKELEKVLRQQSGTDYVEIYGAPVEEILVELDPHLASALGITSVDVANAIARADAKVSAGQLNNPQNQFLVEVKGALDSLERIRQIPVVINQGGESSLYRAGDLARIERQVRKPETELAIIDGQQGLVIGVRMLPDVRVDAWTARLHQYLDDFTARLSANVKLSTLFEQDQYTQDRLGQLVGNVALGFVIITLVLFVTLGLRAAVIVALALPLTSLFTLSVMKMTGLPIHQMSVTGLVVALGIMVDNAIVMADAIQTNRTKGLSPVAAARRAIQHFWLPLLGSSLTTILAFMPLVLMPGPAGEFISGIAYSVIFSLIGSYLISHTLVAGLAGRWLTPPAPGQTCHWYGQGLEIPKLADLFTRSVRWSINHPKLTIPLVLILPLLGFWGKEQMTEQFFPPSDRDMFHIELFLPPQSSIEATHALTQSIDEQLAKQADIKHVSWFIGNNAPAFYYNLLTRQQGANHYAQAMVTASDFTAANRLIPQLQIQLDDLYPQAQILVRKLEQGPPFNAPIELRLFGPNLDTLQALGEEARRILLQTEYVTHSRATLQPGTPKIWLTVEEEAAHFSGLSLVQMAGQLQQGLYGTTRGTVLETTESIPVRIRIADQQRSSLSELANFSLTAQSPQMQGGNIPLTALADISMSPSRGAIPRRYGQRVNVIEGYLRADVLPETVLALYSEQLERAGFTLPQGYWMEFGGESAKRDKAVGNLLASIGLIVTLLLSVVVLSFNSFRLTAVIMLTAVLSAGLGLLSVFVSGYPFGFTVIVGLLGLMGLAINAAIVILAEMKVDPAACRGEPEAILAAVGKCTRHIVSTTITTVCGFMPLMLSGGGFWPPFAIAIAGGTALTTLLSFYFVPAAFCLAVKHRPLKVKTEKQVPDMAQA